MRQGDIIAQYEDTPGKIGGDPPLYTYFLYGVTAILLTLSFVKSRERTLRALKGAWRSFENVLPQLLTVLFIVALALTILDAETISRLLGAQSGFLGIAIAALFGSITMIPSFVSFALGASLLNSGAGYTQVATLITTLTMVGVVTFPMETHYFGKKLALKRNLLALVFAVISGLVIGGVLS